MFFNFTGFVQLFIFIIFIVAVASIIRSAIANNKAPRLIVEAVVVNLRHVSDSHTDANGLTFTDDTYYVTFQVESGDRMEFRVTRSQYHTFQKADFGRLHFHGKVFDSFEKLNYLT